MEEKRKIFLEDALEEQFSLKRLDQSLVVIPSKQWVFYLILLILMISFIAWSFLGSIPLTIVGQGLILDLDKLTTQIAEEEGIVQEIASTQGMPIKKGDLLVRLNNSLIFFELKFYKKVKDDIFKEYVSLLEQIEMERKNRHFYLENKLLAIKEAQENKKRVIAITEESLDIEKNLVNKNILTLPTLNKTQIELISAKNDLRNIQADYLNTEFELSKQYRQEEIWEKNRQLQEADLQLGLATTKFNLTRTYAKENGTLVGSFAYPGAMVTKGTPLITLQKEKLVTLFYAYFPLGQSKAIHKGMKARIALEKFVFKKYGYLIGTVKEVSLLPSTDSTILAKLFNPKLISLFEKEPVTQVIIELQSDPLTPTGLQWSSGIGPDSPITIGSLGSAYVIVDAIAPFYFLFPDWQLNVEEDR